MFDFNFFITINMFSIFFAFALQYFSPKFFFFLLLCYWFALKALFKFNTFVKLFTKNIYLTANVLKALESKCIVVVSEIQ